MLLGYCQLLTSNDILFFSSPSIFQEADSQPKFALMFTEYAKGSDYRSNGTTGPKKSQEVVDYIKSLLPRDCVYLSLMTPGTVGEFVILSIFSLPPKMKQLYV